MRAVWLHIRPRPFFLYLGLAIVLLFAVAVFLALQNALAQGDARTPFVLAVAIAATVGLLSWQFRAWRRAFHSQPSLRGTHTLVFSDTGVSGVSDLSEGEALWEAFVSWRESSDLFVLYSGTDSMHAVPKRWFPDPERVAELRNLLDRLPLQRLF